MVRLAKSSRFQHELSVAVGDSELRFALASGRLCNAAQYRLIQGETMGTYYRIQYARRRLPPSQFTVDQLLGNLTKVCDYIADSG